MLRATLKSLAARKLRLGMSAFAIVIGVAFVVGSFVFTDTLNKAFNDVFGDLSADVVVRPATPEGQEAWVAFAGAGTSVTVPADLVGEVEDLPEVEWAEGEIEDSSVFVLDQDDKVVGVAGSPGVAVNWYEEPAGEDEPVLSVVDGRPPERAGEVALDDQTIESTGYQIGDEIPMITLGDEPRITAELVGVVRFGESGSLAGATLAVFETATAQELFLDGADAFNRISVNAADGTSAEEARDAVAAVLPDNLEAMTGDDVDDEIASAVEEGLGFFTTFLLVFAAVALFVGIFLILNTFSILVAQRSQEMALLRALGASRRQVNRSVLLEALIVGLIGSTLGLLLGLGVAVLLRAAFAAFGMDFGGSLVLQPRTVIVAYVVGVLVTMVAAVVPARRAAKVPPVAAMRDDVVLPSSSRRTHGLAGGILTVGGAAAMATGLSGAGPALMLVGVGILAVFVGVALLAPLISGPIVRVIAGWYPRMFGTVGRLARENALRNPRRTAATASALMIGLALVSAIAVIGSSTNKSIDQALDDGLEAEFVIANATSQPFSPSVADEVEETDGVRAVSAIRAAPAVVEGRQEFLTAIDSDTYPQAAELTMIEGSADLAGGGAIVGADKAEGDDIEPGDTVGVQLPSGTVDLPVVGVYDDNPLLSGSYIVGLDTLAEMGVPPADSALYVVTEPGAELTEVQTGLDSAVGDLPTVTVQNQEEYKESQRSQVNQLLYIVYALLGLAVLIAILGIINTLALSVMERTREVGLLRAVGLSRRQLRRTIRLESIAIAVLGALLGVALGIAFGVALQQAISDEGLAVLDVPVGQLLVFILLAAVIGVLAAVWPARRAARLDVLHAITTE